MTGVAISGPRKSEREVACTAHLASGIYKCQRVRRGGKPSSTHSPHFAFLCVQQLYFDSLNSQRTCLISEMSSFNNFTGTDFGYPYFEEEGHIDPDAPIAGPSRSQDWYLNPAPEGDGEQSGYEGSTLLDASGNQLVDPHAVYPDAFGSSEAGKSFCC